MIAPTDRDVAQWRHLLARSTLAPTLVLSAGVALHAIVLYLTSTMLPSIVADLGGLSLYAWNTSLFVLGSILGSAFAGATLRSVGARRAYAGAAAVFAGGSAVCAVAPAMILFVLGRFVQGLGGGVILGVCYAMVRTLYDEPLWPRALALLSGMWGVATVVGPALGGGLARSWRVAFASIVVMTLTFAAAAMLFLPRSAKEPGRVHIPWRDLGLLSCAIVVVSASGVLTNMLASGSTLAVGAILLLFVLRRGSALVPRARQAGQVLGSLYAAMALLAGAVTSSEVFLPYFLQELHGLSPLGAGYLAATMAAGWTIGSLTSAGFGEQGIARTLRAAPFVTSAALLALAMLVPLGGRAFGPIVLALVVAGLAVGMAWPHVLTRILAVARSGAADPELASSAITTVQLVAASFGAALAGVVANAAGPLGDGGNTERASTAVFALFAFAPLVARLMLRRAGG